MRINPNPMYLTANALPENVKTGFLLFFNDSPVVFFFPKVRDVELKVRWKDKNKRACVSSDNVYICCGNHGAGCRVGKKRDYINVKVILNSQTLACDPQILMKYEDQSLRRSMEADRQQDTTKDST